MNRDDAASEFLTALEKQEAGLLAWGVPDGSFSDNELDEHARQFLDAHQLWSEFNEVDDLVKLAEELELLFPFRVGTQSRYRTRSAETVRLMLRLRQLFPKHAGAAWRSAPLLVADGKFMTRPRFFPRRDVGIASLLAALGNPEGLRRKVLETLVGLRELAGFQRTATSRILHELDRNSAAGTVVCAGTGSGKTLAFYLPALTYIAESIDGDNWVRCLAIYPRNELLKDQFTEALGQCRLLRGVMAESGRRPLRIGALFGPTPRHHDAFDSPWPPKGWRRVEGGYVCPLLRCPESECGSDMVWRDSDRVTGKERLICSAQSDHTVEPTEIVLTRDRLRQIAPDVLFTTTEMLNQRMSDSRFGRLFGIGQSVEKKPRLLLLDEVHTYSGTPGAQTAFLLRRWQHRARCRPHIVGLSATLRDAVNFFAALTGLPPSAVDEVAPLPRDLVPKGAEYLLALRGDPAAGASLLSVSIQAAMLLARVLDTSQGISRGLFGSKLFAFTDDLDVTNRLFFNLLDAEGQDSWGRPKQADATGSLANLRSRIASDAVERMRDGQSWELCERIGHILQPDVFTRVGRTSSQDAGVDAGANQIVATAALEVGFNDPAVGAVMQHKAPIDPAAFLQRKGRAGRNPRMRPWTVVVLSDYGRDRLAYQAYDLLFDPKLPARELPTGNQHVRRMQGAFATLDWLGFQLEGQAPGSVWQDVSLPVEARTKFERDAVRKRQQRIAVLIEEVLTRPERREDLAAYLRHALQVSATDVDRLFWESPRPLLTAVMPTILRRLRTQWHNEFYEPNAPIPEFIPRALFQDLSVPECTVVTPSQEQGEGERRDPMRVGQALNEFAPGRVSRRFGVEHRHARHWVSPSVLVGEGEQLLRLSVFVPPEATEVLGRFETIDCDGQVSPVPCVRPWELRTSVPPDNIVDSSNAVLDWRTQIVPTLSGIPATIPNATPWAQLIVAIEFFTHTGNCPVEVRRFAVGCEASIGFDDGRRLDQNITFTDDDGRPVAVGFAHDADAMLLRLKLPDDLYAIAASQPRLLRSLRVGFFRYRIRNSSALDGIVNVFGRDWLAQGFLCAAAGYVANGNNLPAFVQQSSDDCTDAVAGAIDVLFQAIPVDGPGHEPDAESADSMASGPKKAHQKLRDALSDPTVIAVLRDAAPTLWEMPDDSWTEWLRAALKATIGAAAADAVARLCPDVNAREVFVDPEPGPRPTGAVPAEDEEVWLTESAVGGGGVLEKLQKRFGEDPRRFFEMMVQSLEPTDFETADAELTRFVTEIVDPSHAVIATAVEAVRAARLSTHAEYDSAFGALLTQLRSLGYSVVHPVVAALAGRLLRAGTSKDSDQLTKDLMDSWRDIEERVGYEIDGRTFAWLASADDLPALTASIGVPLTDRGARFAAISGLLWPRGAVARGQRLSVRNPYVELPVPDRELAIAFLPAPREPINLSVSDALDRIRAALLAEGTAVAQGNAETVRKAILQFLAEPIDIGPVLAYPRVQATKLTGGSVTVSFDVVEIAQ